MLDAGEFVAALRRRGFGLFSGVPCSYLTPLINRLIDASDVRYVGAANEGDAVAIACGAWLGGVRSAVLFQNSGLGNAVNPLASLALPARLPALVLSTWRGEPGGAAGRATARADGAHHARALRRDRDPLRAAGGRADRARGGARARARAPRGEADPLRLSAVEGRLRALPARVRAAAPTAPDPCGAPSPPRRRRPSTPTSRSRRSAPAPAPRPRSWRRPASRVARSTAWATGRTSSTWSARWAAPRVWVSVSRSHARTAASS